MRQRSGGRISAVLIAIATAILLVTFAVLPFLTPAWLSFAQGRADAAAWTGYSEADLRTATDALVRDLVIGPPAFDVVVAGAPVLTEQERAHLRDVRGVFGGLGLLAIASIAVLAVAAARARTAPATWRAVRAGALGLVGAVGVLGVVAAVAFEPAFEVFHRLLFSGNFTFDPKTDRLVQLFPDQLWFETTIGVGAVIVGLGLMVARWSGRRATTVAAAQPDERPAPDPSRAELREVRP